MNSASMEAKLALWRWWNEVGSLAAECILAGLAVILLGVIVREWMHVALGMRHPEWFQHRWRYFESAQGTRVELIRSCRTCGKLEGREIEVAHVGPAAQPDAAARASAWLDTLHRNGVSHGVGAAPPGGGSDRGDV